MKVLLNRIWKDKFRRGLIMGLLFFPSLEIFAYIYDITHGGFVLIPDYAFFLMCNTISADYVFQSIFLWFMPVYCLVLAADDCLEDFSLNYKNVVVSKIGRKKYVMSHLKKSFFLTFVVVSVALFLNLLLVHLCFRGGQYSPYDDELITSQFYQWEVDNPFLTNVLFVWITAFVCGMISMVGTSLAIALHNKKIVYGITLLLWFIPFLQKESLMLLFQPHSEYLLDTLVPLFFEICIIYSVVILLGYYKEVHFES